MVEGKMKFDKSWFVQSRQGNIKDEYFFEKKLGSGGYGAVYLAKNKTTGKCCVVSVTECLIRLKLTVSRNYLGCN